MTFGGFGFAMRRALLLTQLLTVIALFYVVNSAEADDRKYKKSVESYSVPEVVLVNQEGARVRFKSFIETDKPVILDFIYGTCTTICPVLSAGYYSLQKRLGPDVQKVRLV